MMKRLMLFFATLGIGVIATCRASAQEPAATPPELLSRVYFGGLDRLRASTNATTLREIWDMPSTVELRNQTADRVAQALAGWIQSESGLSPEERARLIRPLFEDLWRVEWRLELTRSQKGMVAWGWALRLDEERGRLWKTNLGRFVSGGKPPSDHGSAGVVFDQAGPWFFAGSAPMPSILNRLRSASPPDPSVTDHWLKMELDLSGLARWAKWANPDHLPEVELAVGARGANVRTQTRLTFPHDLNWPLEKWVIPTNTIRDSQNSLISFTAIQGFAAWLSQQPLWRELALSPAPNQFYAWGQSDLPFQIQAAFPVVGATNWLNRIFSLWVPRLNTNLAEHAVGEIRSLTNRAELLWRGLPMIIPFLQPAPEPDREFLWGGIFPIDLPTNPPPAALLAQLNNRTNLVYYNWEITQGRLAQLRPLAQLLSVVTTLPTFSTNSLSQKWLEAVEPKLGNTITEISVTSPRELTLVRNAHLGLNGLELLALAYWLDDVGFPRWNFQPRFRLITNPR